MLLKKIIKAFMQSFYTSDINKSYKDERLHLRGTSNICYYLSMFELIEFLIKRFY